MFVFTIFFITILLLQMNFSKDSSLVKVIRILSEMPPGVSPLTEKIVSLSKLMLPILEQQSPCSVLQADALETVFELFRNNFVERDLRIHIPHTFAWEPVALYFLFFVALNCRTKMSIGKKRSTCRWAQSICGYYCKMHHTSQVLMRAMEESARKDEIMADETIDELFHLAQRIYCPVCDTIISNKDNFAFFPECHHFACLKCTKSLLIKAAERRVKA